MRYTPCVIFYLLQRDYYLMSLLNVAFHCFRALVAVIADFVDAVSFD